MNWKTIVNNTMSKELGQGLVYYFAENPDKIPEFLEYIASNNGKGSSRSAWVLTHIWDKFPHLLHPYISDIIQILTQPVSEGTQRSIIRILQYSELPEEEDGFLVEYLFSKLIDPKQAIAIRAFSIAVLGRLVQKYPDLHSEFKLCLEALIPNASSGLKNRATKYLKQLNKDYII